MVDLVLISVVIGAVASLLRATRVGDREAEVLSKTVASLGFVALGAVAWRAGDPVATRLVAGLVLCAIGDVLLLWPRSFDAGLASFLLGHLGYVAAFHAAVPTADWTRWTLLPIALASVAALWWLWSYLGRRRLPVAAYVAVITVMVWGALSTADAGALGWKIAIGAVLFYLSDLTVARDHFVRRDVVNRAVGLPMYYLAQVLIALSV